MTTWSVHHTNGAFHGHQSNGHLRGASAPAEIRYQPGGKPEAQAEGKPELKPASRHPIPFNVPTQTGRELPYMAQAIQSTRLAGDGLFTKKSHQLLEATLGVPKVLLTTSCTHALEMSALLLHIQPGDEVIVPSFTAVSTINAFVLRGARPVFGDIRPDTLNLDESKLEALITPRTKAIVPVHYGGVACEMDPILILAAHHGIAVVEDNAHGLYARYKGRYLGSMGALATQSFHETKNFTCGEGGALIINDQRCWEQAEIVREKGTNRSRFFRGQEEKCTWVDLGSSYLPSDLLAAYLYAQLESRIQIQQKRRLLWDTYAELLRPWAESNGIQLPVVPAHCEQAYHLFYLLMPSLAVRTDFINYLRAQGIESAVHYLPLHTSAMGSAFGGRTGDCPVAESVSERLVRLPFYTEMNATDLGRVADAILHFHLKR